MSRHLRDALVFLSTFVALFVCGEVIVQYFQIPRFVVPAPSEICQTLFRQRAILWTSTLYTSQAALSGFALSLIAGTMLGLVFSELSWVRIATFPYFIFLQTVPIVAIAPVVVGWFGYGFASVVAVSFLISLFPILNGATRGLMTPPPELVELFRLYRGTRWQTLWKLRLPNAVPGICTAAGTATGLAVVGAVVGEFFVGYRGSRHGLGYMIMVTTDQLQTAGLFAAVLCSTTLGLIMFGLVQLATRTVLRRWSLVES